MQTEDLQKMIDGELGLGSANTDTDNDSFGMRVYALCFERLIVEVQEKISTEKKAEFKKVLETGTLEALKSFIEKNIGPADEFINQSFEKTILSIEGTTEKTASAKPLERLEEAKKIIDADIAALLKIPHFTNTSHEYIEAMSEWQTLKEKNAHEILKTTISADPRATSGKIALWVESVASITKELPQKEETIAEYTLRAVSTYLAHAQN